MRAGSRSRRPKGGAWNRFWLYQPGSGPSRRPLFRLHVEGVGDRARPLDLAGRAQPRQTAARAAAPTRPPAATHRAADSRSSPSRSRARAAGAATRSLCARRTRSPAAPPGQANAYGPDSGNAAPPSAKAARAAPKARPKRSTAQQPSAPLPAWRRMPTAFVARERVPSFRFEFLVPPGLDSLVEVSSITSPASSVESTQQHKQPRRATQPLPPCLRGELRAPCANRLLSPLPAAAT